MSNKTEWTDEAITREYAKNLGTSIEEFNPAHRNPLNSEALSALDHNDIWGFEARVFSICFQEIRNLVGPFKIFGSFEDELVGSCVHEHVDAWHKTLRAMGQNP